MHAVNVDFWCTGQVGLISGREGEDRQDGTVLLLRSQDWVSPWNLKMRLLNRSNAMHSLPKSCDGTVELVETLRDSFLATSPRKRKGCRCTILRVEFSLLRLRWVGRRVREFSHLGS